ncbi:hypothetical protein BGY98DRAFT_547062 [Russula aff. rugulosa BPL654]|nr:hypothetical protein BGY98DRAFT_547062 [Russula aff. rugulosa BPL654]
MHLYKTITQTLLILSIPNLVFAAPIPRGTDTVQGGTMKTPSQYQSSSPDGLPPRDSLSLGGSAPLQDSASSSGSESPPSSHFRRILTIIIPRT